MTEKSLAGKVVLVTGAAGGLGAEVAARCGQAGATMVLLGRTIPKLERVYDRICESGGPQPAIYPLDLAGASEKDYFDLASVLERELGALHGLIHCAAELGTLGPLADVDAGRWQRIMQINLGAPFLLTRALFPLLAQGAPAKVVFIGDSSIGMGKAYWNAYGVAKLGLEGYARILADETESSGVGVRLFTPGPMRTPIRRQAYPGETPELLPAAESVAAAVLDLLCS